MRLLLQIARIVSGSVLVALGIAGCVLPILPGIPFLLVGLGLLSVDIPLVRRLRDGVSARLREQWAKFRRR